MGNISNKIVFQALIVILFSRRIYHVLFTPCLQPWDAFSSHMDSSPHLHGLKVIYHPLYGMNNYVLIWGDWLSCAPLRGSNDS